MVSRVFIVGYYYRNNYGDDLFMNVFKNYFFKDQECIFINSDDLDMTSNQTMYNIDLIVIGGGDILNYHFLNEYRISNLLSFNVPIYFIGIGVSFENCTHFLDCADRVYVRSLQDKQFIIKHNPYYPESFIHVLPDLAFMLQVNPTLYTSTELTIGVCIPATWNYNNIHSLDQRLSEHGLSITYIPFDTSNDPINSDSLYLQRQGLTHRITPVSNMDQCHFILAGRFHCIIKCILHCIPCIPIVHTTKVANLLDSFPELKACSITLEELGSDKLIEKLNYVKHNYQKLCSLFLEFSQKSKHELITKFPTTFEKRLCSPRFPIYSQEILKSCIDILTTTDSSTNSSTNSSTDFSTDSTISNSLKVKQILFNLTRDPNGKYYYGLLDSINATNMNNTCSTTCSTQTLHEFHDKFKWLIQDYAKYQTIPKCPLIEYRNINFHDIHRSGWQYVVSNMMMSLESTSSILIDTFVDKTFHWDSDFYQLNNMIPVKKSWIGFIHHTFNTFNNQFNCDTLFKNPIFLDSLEHCKGLVVMSNQLKRDILHSIFLPVPIYVVSHPTEFVENTFTWTKYINNPHKNLIQIGTWMRNTFSIYDLRTKINKKVLRNKNNDNYFPPVELKRELEQGLENSPNIFIKCMNSALIHKLDSVQPLYYANNQEYDQLLSENIVFLDLLDCAACNTLIECIVRNTPILINKLPAVVEYLGEEYPLYYTSLNEAESLLQDEIIQKAHLYLTRLDKSFLQIDTFLRQVQTILNTINNK